MTTRSFTPMEFFPTSPRSGNEGTRVFRMQNMIIRGEGARSYAEAYGGSYDLIEDIATAVLTGTVAIDPGTLTVIGGVTAFKTELHPGQFLLAYAGSTGERIPMVVDEVIDDTHFTICRYPHASNVGATVVRLPVLFDLDNKRGTLLRGNAVVSAQGTILCVGDGTLRRNGTALPGTSLAAARTPKIAILDDTTGNYTVAPLGMATPATLSAVGIAGTGKNMPAGLYSVRAVPARISTRGYNNPSPKAEVTLTAGQRIQVTVPAADTANLQDAWMFFATLYSPSLTGAGVQGPWYRYELPEVFVRVGSGGGEIPAAGGTYNIEYNDAEISGADLLQFNNNAPPHAEFIAWMTGIPIWVSCNGPGDTSPGPYIRPGKPRNIEAAPAALFASSSPPDTIIGAVVGVQGRLYLLGINTLQIAVATQLQDGRLPPFAVRPFWRSGFKNPEALLCIGDNIMGITNNGLARSISEGDEGSEEYRWATAIEEFLQQLEPAHCLLKLDPRNNAAVLFHSGHSINASGWWTTRAWMYGLRENKWIGDVLLTSTTGDMLVSSAAVVAGRLEFLAGGRQAAGTTVVRTYRWDEPTPFGMGPAEPVPYYIAWQFSDWGAEDRCKAVKAIAVVGKQAAGGTAGIHGAGPGEAISVSTLEAGNSGSKSGTITLPITSTPTQLEFTELDVDNLKQFTVRVDGTWTGGERDRIDEVVVDAVVRGARR